MAIIGTFTANADGSFSGAIRTLTIDLKAVQFRPVANKPAGKSPDYRVFAGKAELGAAWKKTSKANNDYLSVKLDDPSFTEPLDVALMLINGVQSLVWSRPEPKTED
jgi:uncharacterized protein (DUF736 family)